MQSNQNNEYQAIPKYSTEMSKLARPYFKHNILQ